jgi:antitoxin component YwqK of YwqJK toxin-antitoxin module
VTCDHLFLIKNKKYILKMLTGNKDLDFEILNNLSDKDLIAFCQTNSRANEICNDQIFWQRRTIKNYGEYISVDMMHKYKKGDRRAWSDYYIELNEKTKKAFAYNLAKALEKNREDIETIIRKKHPNINIVYEDGIYYDKSRKFPIPQGKYKMFYPNGNIKKTGNYLDGVKIKEWKTYYPNGNLDTISRYKKNNQMDILDGEQIKYTVTGNLEIYEFWDNNKLVERKFYDN